MAALPAMAPTTNLGFLTILRDGSGYVGGYLVTNSWGRPLEFRLSSAVQPNRVQQILYGQSLEPYVCADLLGKTLVDKTATGAGIILTDHPAALDLRLRLEVPVALVSLDDPAKPLSAHAHFPSDAPVLRDLLDRLGSFDFAEPFTRIREAVAEARKLGVAAKRGAPLPSPSLPNTIALSSPGTIFPLGSEGGRHAALLGCLLAGLGSWRRIGPECR